MSTVIQRPTWVQRLRPLWKDLDAGLLLACLWLMVWGLVAMYSIGHDHGTRFVDHARNFVIGAGVMLLVAQVPAPKLTRIAVPLYAVGVALLIAVALFGITKKGATRWLNLGVTVIQPSELLKIATPLMLAYWFQLREGQLKLLDFVIAFVLLGVPFGLIAKQPDLGTGLLVLFAGLYVIYFAGLSWKLIIPLVAAGVIAIGSLIAFESQICVDEVKWPLLKDYQKTRVCTLLDPHKDPLGKGFHVLQGGIAIGSGGVTGKGFMQGSQTHLEFIPERTTDFLFAAFAEEFGLLGALALLLGFGLLLFRGLSIAANAPSLFERLLGGAVTLSLFTYVFVNMGMVIGILPVVGVPLPFMSYGGTAMVMLGLSLGILLAIGRSRAFIQR
ncbi:rod shape-determining protein RodA [Inhella gelatinilytica]|uniref:Peptidoglycan glycosyltransferase MrdB n=1 Tax=Inhella gelatinilytica TaxID=2795030 RepID=A0A931ISF9_9BURK|nr:rod shape-determining protein RodA [Inhella gelatinilytica]MBH9551842.1 rod shape-determining protein RodA [Inhella gelatinilytica]